METTDRAPYYMFRTKGEADAFCKRMRDIAYKVDVVTVNDILLDRKEHFVIDGGYQHGYTRKDCKKLKPEKCGSEWIVTFPCAPGKMIRDAHGHWTTENGG